MSVLNLPTRPTISDIHKLYRDEGVSVVEITDYFFEKISSYDDLIKSLLRTTKNRAAQKAQELDLILQKAKDENHKIVDSVSIVDPFGSALSATDLFWFDDLISKYPLFGIPFVAKDNILIEGEITTGASKILEGFIAPFSSDVFNSMDQAGAVLLGQSNMDEFAFGSSTEK